MQIRRMLPSRVPCWLTSISKAILGVLSTQRLPFPSNSFDMACCSNPFDMAHCSRCLIPWIDKIRFLEQMMVIFETVYRDVYCSGLSTFHPYYFCQVCNCHIMLDDIVE
ncbi:uncharacterized protein LOC143870578 [Tasmannia lanceolata]|uniref:uncharacterized protein LOC143870578 n=1 Tax=Tasmannia lanceolata TaxID=3420 RepID=UPI00406357C6